MILPEIKNWKVVHTPDILYFQEGPGVRKWQFQEDGVKLLNVGNINDNRINLSATKIHISEEEAYGKYSHFLIDEGDLLIACSGIVVDNFHNKIAFVKKEHLPLCLNTSTMRFKVLEENQININFFKYFLGSDLFKKQIQKLITGSAQLNFGPSHMKKIKIPLPPIHIQERIAEILDAADALRQKDRQLLEKYEQLSQSIFLDMFGDPMSNRNKFKTYRVSEVCEKILGGGTPSKSNKSFYIGEIPWVTPKDMKVEDIKNSIDKVNIDAVENSSAKLIPANSILMVIRSGILKKKLPVAINRVEVTVNQDMKAFIPNSNLITNEYLLNVFKASEPYLLGKVRAVTADNIEFKQIKDLKIPVPDLDLQEKFCKSIGKVKKQKSLLHHNIQKSESLFQSLLQKAFKGELVPEDQLKPA